MYSDLTFNVGKSDGDIQLQQTLNNLTLTIEINSERAFKLTKMNWLILINK